MKFHRLKLKKCYHEEIRNGFKTCEIRLNDRDYQKGDEITFVDPETSNVISVVNITHVLHGFEGLKDGWVALSIQLIYKTNS